MAVCSFLVEFVSVALDVTTVLGGCVVYVLTLILSSQESREQSWCTRLFVWLFVKHAMTIIITVTQQLTPIARSNIFPCHAAFYSAVSCKLLLSASHVWMYLFSGLWCIGVFDSARFTEHAQSD
jgi:hypothetical protein